jgi:hypothetical protein
VKSNRLFATSLKAKHQGEFQRVDSFGLKDKQTVRGYLKGYDKEVLLVRRIFTNTVRTQIDHIFLSIGAVFKLECLKIKHSLNHFALTTKLLIRANQVAFAEL